MRHVVPLRIRRMLLICAVAPADNRVEESARSQKRSEIIFHL